MLDLDRHDRGRRVQQPGHCHQVGAEGHRATAKAAGLDRLDQIDRRLAGGRLRVGSARQRGRHQ